MFTVSFNSCNIFKISFTIIHFLFTIVSSVLQRTKKRKKGHDHLVADRKRSLDESPELRWKDVEKRLEYKMYNIKNKEVKKIEQESNHY